jgi:hypothetical protein
MSAARTGFRAQTPADRPLVDLWRLIRTALTGVDGDKYFAQLKDAEIPPGKQMFTGRVVSRLSPTTVVVNADNPAGDVTLKFNNALTGIDPGTLVYFNGIVESYVKEPFMLMLRTDDFVVPVNVSPPRTPR